ncbi:MAG: hypothetical protein AAFQ63_02230 [Cyanobacteria bacterium J06621_11]
MVPLELLTVPLDFLLILLVNGTPTAECMPMVLDQAPATEQRESFLQCQMVADTIDGIEPNADFLVKTTHFIEQIESAFASEDDSEFTIQLAPTPAAPTQIAEPNTN